MNILLILISIIYTVRNRKKFYNINSKINIITDKKNAYNELEKFIKRKKIFPFNIFNEKNCNHKVIEGTEGFYKEVNLKKMNFEDISKLIKSYNIYQEAKSKTIKDIVAYGFIGEKAQRKYNKIELKN